MIKKIKNWVGTHKIISILIIVALIVAIYFIFFRGKVNSESSFVTEIVKKSSITTTVTGVGQIETSDTIDLKPKVSGDITYIGVKVGQEVKTGSLIASLDSREAKLALENAELSLEELIKDPDNVSLNQKQKAVVKAYNDGFNNTSLAIVDFTSIISELESFLYNGYLGSRNVSMVGGKGREQADIVDKYFYDAQKSLKNLSKFYKNVGSSDEKDKVEELVDMSYETSRLFSLTLNESQKLFNLIVNEREEQGSADTLTMQSDLSSWFSTSNSYIDKFMTNGTTILESIDALQDLLDGALSIDIKSAQLNVEEKKNAYNDHFIRAPISGIIASLDASIGDTVNASIGTLVTKQKIATISLNEVDITSVVMGQDVNLTFDAISKLSILGKVYEISPTGTVSSGVVTYDVKISFSDDDERVKSGMSVNIEIITAQKNDILVVSSGVVKTRNNSSYVEVIDEFKNIQRKEVEIGISDDTLVEIISGLKEGDIVVLRTGTVLPINNRSNATRTNPVGGMPMGGSAIRMMR
jgi:HlyD family secretion protein